MTRRARTKTSCTHFVSSRGLKPRDPTLGYSSPKFDKVRPSGRSFAVSAAQDETANNVERVIISNRAKDCSLTRRRFGNRRSLKQKRPSQKHRAPAELQTNR